MKTGKSADCEPQTSLGIVVKGVAYAVISTCVVILEIALVAWHVNYMIPPDALAASPVYGTVHWVGLNSVVLLVPLGCTYVLGARYAYPSEPFDRRMMLVSWYVVVCAVFTSGALNGFLYLSRLS